MTGFSISPQLEVQELVLHVHVGSQGDIVSIWNGVSEYIHRHLLLNRGVKINGLGTFFVVRQYLPKRNDFPVQRPVFNLSTTVAVVHQIKYTNRDIPGDVMVLPVYHHKMRLEPFFRKRTVEQCMGETMICFSHLLGCEYDVDFVFRDIGVLVIREKRVQMRFYKEFLDTLDQTGTLAEALLHDPVTKDLVITDRKAIVPQSDDNDPGIFMFPRLEIKRVCRPLFWKPSRKKILKSTQGKKAGKELLDEKIVGKVSLFGKYLLGQERISSIKLTELKREERKEPLVSQLLAMLESTQEGEKVESKHAPDDQPLTVREGHCRARKDVKYLPTPWDQKNCWATWGKDRRQRERADLAAVLARRAKEEQWMAELKPLLEKAVPEEEYGYTLEETDLKRWRTFLQSTEHLKPCSLEDSTPALIKRKAYDQGLKEKMKQKWGKHEKQKELNPLKLLPEDILEMIQLQDWVLKGSRMVSPANEK
ncbi:coiled-coil domain-containing protein 81-like isoform X2 [Nothoprocta perdicaria]|uniref:coiled-coil domain-containing protein 81-like isoform X2 n=1 Tax=Nothoprocta perdicaria TaxID=30464 RepID=UPI000E1BB35D|nr:coiled-coil domain-containing protein 81-like isoform X2 [Nothoprocta perdicaria]